MSYLAYLLGHITLCVVTTTAEAPLRLRMLGSYLFGTGWMPITELRQILTQGDRDALEEARQHLRDLRPTCARLPGLFGAPALGYGDRA